jgi:subtilisin family serine protease
MAAPIRSFFGPVLCATLTWLGSAAATAQVPDAHASHPFAQSRPIAGRYIVVFKDSVGNPAAEAANAVRGSGGQLHYTYSAAIKGFAATLPDSAVQALRNNPNVDYVEQDQTVSLSAEVLAQSPATWGLDRIDQQYRPLDTVYHYGYNGTGVTAFIIDTGIYASHEDFAGRVLAGATFINDGRGTNDCNGHGTHVAGTVGGTRWGVAKGVSLVPVRVLDCRGSGSYSGVIAGIDWMVDSVMDGEVSNGTKPAVANMSLGGGKSTAMNSAVAGAVTNGVIMVVAAGNSSADACNYSPSSEPSAITVGATTSSDARSSYSNYGSCVDIFAPGSSITSAWNTGSNATNTISGTSMASPHVAGAAALALQVNPSALPAAIGTMIVDNATANLLTSVGAGSPNRLLYSLAKDTASQPATVAVSGILGAFVRKGKTWRAQATVTIGIPDSPAIVSNATVSGEFLPEGGAASCITGGSGSCTLTSGAISANATTFSVTTVSGTNLVYDSGKSLQNSLIILK